MVEKTCYKMRYEFSNPHYLKRTKSNWTKFIIYTAHKAAGTMLWSTNYSSANIKLHNFKHSGLFVFFSILSRISPFFYPYTQKAMSLLYPFVSFFCLAHYSLMTSLTWGRSRPCWAAMSHSDLYSPAETSKHAVVSRISACIFPIRFYAIWTLMTGTHAFMSGADWLNLFNHHHNFTKCYVILNTEKHVLYGYNQL